MSRHLSASFAALCLVLVASTSTEAFGVSPHPHQTSGCHHPLTFSSALHLLPQQGNQLAAWEAAHADDVPGTSEEHATKKLTSAREFVARVFSLPNRRKIPSEEEIFVWPSHAEEAHDVVYYPIVGFQYIKVSADCNKNQCRAIPTLHAAGTCATCRLPSSNEELVGYYSPRVSCKLLHCDDGSEDEYCASP